MNPLASSTRRMVEMILARLRRVSRTPGVAIMSRYRCLQRVDSHS